MMRLDEYVRTDEYKEWVKNFLSTAKKGDEVSLVQSDYGVWGNHGLSIFKDVVKEKNKGLRIDKREIYDDGRLSSTQRYPIGRTMIIPDEYAARLKKSCVKLKRIKDIIEDTQYTDEEVIDVIYENLREKIELKLLEKQKEKEGNGLQTEQKRNDCTE